MIYLLQCTSMMDTYTLGFFSNEGKAKTIKRRLRREMQILKKHLLKIKFPVIDWVNYPPFNSKEWLEREEEIKRVKSQRKELAKKLAPLSIRILGENFPEYDYDLEETTYWLQPVKEVI